MMMVKSLSLFPGLRLFHFHVLLPGVFRVLANTTLITAASVRVMSYNGKKRKDND